MRNERFGFVLALRDIPDLVGAEIRPGLALSSKPTNFQAIKFRSGAQTNMDPVAILR